MQARRLVRIEMRRNLLSKRAWWIYFLAFVPTVIILIHLLIETSSAVWHGGRHHGAGRDGAVLLHAAGDISLDVWEFFRG